ncbi:Ig-like domain-containing protein [Flavobacterium soyangense]|uniref:T9SS type B sorting domain-containing protein n=1 Tax=Flavobacterium soyangense TaxID=2023265 RepID=A0A930UFL6_9FLAO|nr:T9SS type B sorting domain-containing protein [Flavobacterium soyangense]MBF2709570.1 T9SS type B sorting domain-containing protein [Flavobacterium soyangense]
MKKLLFLVLLLSNFFGYAQYTLIPDVNFELALIGLGIDSGAPDGKVLTANVSGITNLDVSKKAITNLSGIQDFTSLEYLLCIDNQLTSLDVTKNTALIRLSCNQNQLTSLDVTKNTNLNHLSCSYNYIISIDVTKNTALTLLDCSNNQITSLDVTKNTALTLLDCSNNQITSLDVTKNTALTFLSCSTNQISSLDVTKNMALTFLSCSTNQISSLDVTKNTALTLLDCSNNQITSLDVTKNTALTFLSCFNIKINSLDVSKNIALTDLFSNKNQLTILDVSKNTLLNVLNCSDNKITILDVSTNTNLSTIACSSNNLTFLNLKNGNNTKILSPYFKNNPNLSCIQVDNKSYSDANWSTAKDTTANYSENCSKTASILPPVITATGNQIYCPGTSLNIVETISITNDPAEPDTNAIYIQVSSGYINGQDKLTLANPLSHPNITMSWDVPTGKLKLYSPSGIKIPYADFVSAIKDVEFSNSSTSPSGIRNFSITIGQANYLPSTGHYYQYVPSIGITWTAAKATAEGSNYYGLKGYLATILAADEAQLSGKQAAGAGWIGGSDAAVEGTWRWVTGPEGLANGGAGTVFWIGTGNGYSPLPINFAFWNETGNDASKWEPNQSNGNQEDYAHVTAPGVGNPGSWNDLSNTGEPSGNYQPKGYIVEYGGMPGDPILQISASTSITIPKITSTTPSYICGSGVVTLQATVSDGILNWYTSSTGGSSIGTGNSYTTPTIYTSTSYYVDATSGNCQRTEIIATIKPLPSLPQIAISSTSPVLYCQNDIPIPLVATASANCTLNWYTLPSGGIASGTSPTPITTVVGSTTYYVSQTNTTTNCESPREAIIVTVNPLPTAPIVNNINYCNNETAVPLTALFSSSCTLNWYASATGGTSNATSPTPSTATVGITKYYVSQTITATGCEGPRAEMIVTVNPLPTTPIANNIAYCNNEIASPLTATASANCSLNWYSTPTGGTPIATSPTPSTSSVGTTKYYVSQTITATGCEGPRSEIIVTVNPLPIVRNVIIVQCDTDLISDGKTLFNLTVNNDAISANYGNEIFTYYTSLNGANNAVPADLIPNELAFENTTPTLMDIWSRITNKITGCHSIAKITLKVPATNINPKYKIPFPPVCDDFLDSNGNNTANNNKRDGITSFDFSATKAIILAKLPANQAYDINYYKNEADALAEINVITDISNYRNIGYPNSQDIWIRIDSDLDNACYGLGPYLTLNVEALPTANAITIPRQCDDDKDGIFTFNTSSLESDLLKGQTNVTVTYFDQVNNPLKDANGVLITTPFPANFTSTSQTIKAVLTNNTPQHCFDETTIQFIVDASPVAFAVPSTLTTVCDDEANPINQDGKFAFDTSTFQTTILGGQTGMIVKYYDQNNVLLTSPLPNPFLTTTQNITAKVQNPLNIVCSASTTLNFTVNPIPNIDLNIDGSANELVCSNLSTFFVTLNAGILNRSSTSNYDYIWTKDGIIVGTNSPTLDVNAEGIYTVEVINHSGCSRIRTITVTASNIATIVSVDVVDLTDVNTVTVNISGPGDYQYSLDEQSGFWQDSNFFNNVPAGIHEIYVNDKNGCGLVHKEIVIVGIPKYFTPNGDTYNDVWEIKGISKYPQAEVQLFDRYGKYLITLNTVNKSWNGTYNNTPLPADDYWYILNLRNGKPEIKGHFSLKR